ncbi:MAG: cytochrome c [Ignavibacterium sp.]|jgi:cytochrome c2|uniref:c-type cytochrome n=1 Tax=Ignavibacterium album TaxID=591197 RepID=UPI0026EDF902|nr:cytochrome c [Ignavibacterium album]MCA2004518.1 cytochrome c [Ignavibacterium sp.]MCX8106437.1 cytochrome c [Ignavibacterium album]
MTKPQIWVAAFLFLFIVLFLIQKATKTQEPEKDFSQMGSGMMQQESNENLTGAELMSNFGCLNCHGTNLEGSAMGPALANLKQYWSRDNLINYLRNPNSFMSQKRFQEYREKYPNMLMPAYGNKDVKDLGKIADYLLGR